mmetsp:Transcript_18273/g.50853  ORF Transcript_18273/g.50853 Transcript_18273/m.50853 type:complete len:219 (+) Transcript_18273:225-881(+)
MRTHTHTKSASACLISGAVISLMPGNFHPYVGLPVVDGDPFPGRAHGIHVICAMAFDVCFRTWMLLEVSNCCSFRNVPFDLKYLRALGCSATWSIVCTRLTVRAEISLSRSPSGKVSFRTHSSSATSRASGTCAPIASSFTEFSTVRLISADEAAWRALRASSASMVTSGWSADGPASLFSGNSVVSAPRASAAFSRASCSCEERMGMITAIAPSLIA